MQTSAPPLSPYHAFRPRADNPRQRDQQAGFVNDRSTFSVCLGGNGSGKTQAAAFKTARFLRETVPHRERLPFWIVGEKYDQICQVWNEKLRDYITPEWILNIQWYRPNRGWPRSVTLRNRAAGKPSEPGWVIDFMSYDQKQDAFKGTAIGGAWLNEECPWSVATEIRRGCRETNAPIWADFTPVKIKSPEWPEMYLKPPDGMKFWHLNTLCNTYIDADWTRQFFAGIPEEFRAMRQYGDFLGLAGQVFGEFRRDIHICEPFEIPHDWKRWRAIDFGFSNPFCCLWLAKGKDGMIYVYDEHYASQRSVKQHAEAIKRRYWRKGDPHYGPTISDHDAQYRHELALEGIACQLANKAIRTSIEAIKSLMMVREDNRPRLQIFSTCANLLRELPLYHWPEGTVSRSAYEEPVDVDNHAVDALRYGVMYDHQLTGFKPQSWKQRLVPAFGVQ